MLNLGVLINRANLGDPQRNPRVLTLVNDLIQGQGRTQQGSQGSGHSLPWAHAIGSYRFFNNSEISLPSVYAIAHNALRELVPTQTRAYLAHDFSVVDYSKHAAKEDRIQVGNEFGLGYDLYSALVLDKLGRPLGPAVQELQTTEGCWSSDSCTPLPFVDHLSQLERGIQAAEKELPERELVHLIDREGDDIQLERFLSGQRKYVIRAQHLVRKVLHDEKATTIQLAVNKLELKKGAEVKRQNEVFQAWQGEMKVIFHGPSYRGCKAGKTRKAPTAGTPIEVRVVVVELRGEKRTLQWILLTNLSDSIAEVVQAYIWRWRIERLFFLKKVGFRLENWLQIEGERIARRLAVTTLAAMVLYQMELGKEEPEMAATIKVVATLGGWLGRKRDVIGPLVLMRGMMLLIGMCSAVEEFGAERLQKAAELLSSQLGLGFASPRVRLKEGV